MPKQIKTEARVWREIARRIADGEWQERGLCAERLAMLDIGQITHAMHSATLVRINAHVMAHGLCLGSFVFPPGTHADERILAALFLALEANDDAREASNA